jgi:hypothetical protein
MDVGSTGDAHPAATSNKERRCPVGLVSSLAGATTAQKQPASESNKKSRYVIGA